MDHQKYFKNLEQVEEKWKELRANNFPQKSRDEFWTLCMKGRELFAIMAMDDIKNGWKLPKRVPSYQRAIMMLEKEKRYKEAILLCEDANKWEIRTDWYSKKIEEFNKKI